MSFKIIVCVKQVFDPDTPSSAFVVDEAAKRVVPAQGIPPVVNGFCENAVEAALKIKEIIPNTEVVILSLGTGFVMDVMKKPLSMGADKMILVENPEEESSEPFKSATILSSAIKKIGDFNLIICGQQASDWDNAQVPLGISELLDIPCITGARAIEVKEEKVLAHSSNPDGYEVIQASLPTLITVNNEIGEPRYPTLRGIMQASRKSPELWSLEDLDIEISQIQNAMTLTELYIPVSDKNCEIIEGESDEDSGRLLALRLREEKII